MLKLRFIILVILTLPAGCGPTATDPYEPPEELPAAKNQDGEPALSEDAGP